MPRVPDRPRVLMVTRFDPFAPRPQPLQVLRAANGLAAAGARVVLLMDRHDPVPPERSSVEAYLGHPLEATLELRYAVGRHPGARGVRRRFAILRCLRAGIDAVLTREMGVTAQLARLRPLGLEVPLIHEWHALPSALGQRDEGEAQTAARADAHVYLTPELAEDVEAAHGARRPHLVLGNGCLLDPVAARESLAALGGARRVLAGSWRRGPADEGLLDGIEGWPPHLELEIAGPERGGTDAPPWLRSLGRLTPGQLSARTTGALCQLALYVDDLNTRRFASPLKVVQALASGVPLVASDLPCVRRTVEDGRTGLLVPPGDAGAVREVVDRLDRDRALALRLASAALEEAPSRSWARRGMRMLAFLEAL